MKNRLLTLFLATALATSLIACGGTQTENAVTESTETVAEETEIPEEVIEAKDAPEANPDLVEATEVIETEEIEIPEYIVTEMSATKYAKSSVNVRSGPSSEYDRVGGLSTNQQVTVTGQADTGWYRIDFNGTEAFVSNSYLVDEKVAVNTTTNTATTNNTTNNTNMNTTQSTTDTSVSYTDTTQPTQTWTDTSASPPVVDTSVQTTPTTDTSANTNALGGAPAIDAGGMTADQLNQMMGNNNPIGTGGADNGITIEGSLGH